MSTYAGSLLRTVLRQDTNTSRRTTLLPSPNWLRSPITIFSRQELDQNGRIYKTSMVENGRILSRRSAASPSTSSGSM